MKKLAVAAAATMMFAGAASAADMAIPVKAVVAPPPPPVFDIAFGVTGTSDYVFRGISQTNNNPAIQGFVELQMFDWVYLNVWASNQSWVENFQVDGNSSLEVDFAGGLRHTWGAFTMDVGGVYYTFPGGTDSVGLSSTDYNYWEIYAKPSYVVAPWLTVGVNLFWTSDMYATGTDGTALSATAKVPLPAFGPGGDFGWYLSGEYGYQWLSTSAFNYDVTYVVGPSVVTVNEQISGYSWWNVGVGFTYKAATLDLRYSGSDLSENNCAYMIGIYNGCGDKFIASLSFATSLNALK
ncbi:TorF family putative porin [Aquabacter cavernae]|uniref:TorF family putative porin n=1 Tax=Aquabacter cavernae TaxID=2496029 RepID=UPI000F8CB689|nr:TorF family putative porin [Aquabacter cavernae]